jgi:hypothetical protein
MTSQRCARLGLIYVLILSSLATMTLAACQPAASPPGAPTPTDAATQAPSAHTPLPTWTTVPTQTPEQPAATGTQSAPSPDGATPNATAGATAGAPASGATATKPPTAAQPPSGGAVQDKYQYLGQDIPDRTQFLPNRTVTITWTVKNIGTNGWTKDYTLRYFSGPKPAKDVYNFTKDVPANGTINFVVTFTTPAEPGDYDLWFKLTNLEGKNFGDLDLVFTVSNNPQKATSTPKK